MTRNITISMDEGVIKKAKVFAARRGQSVSALLRSEILRLVDDDDSYQQAKEAALKRLNRGMSLGGGPYPAREELYGRD
jgi:plasmid stability protein